MGNYGLFYGNGLSLTADRRIMRLLATGNTQQIRPNLHRFEFRCGHLDFAVYFQLLEGGRPSAQHVVHSVGGGVYHAYFVGAPCRVFVYEKKQRDNGGNYGFWLYNESGNLAVDNLDEPIQPLPDLYIPPLDVGGSVFICPVAEMLKTAYNMHCIRGRLAVWFWEREYCIWRDSLIWTEQGLWYVFGHSTVRRQMSADGREIPASYEIYGTSRYNWLENSYSTSLGRIDVTGYV